MLTPIAVTAAVDMLNQVCVQPITPRFTTTAIALPNVNYHNQSDESEVFVPEIVRLSDVRGAVALLIEGALAAGVDADESWWQDVKVVPAEIRERLRRG